METIGNAWLWAGFSGLVLIALMVDLALMRHGGPHRVTFREAAWWSLGWVALAMTFNAALWWYLGETAGPDEARRVGLEFLTGYLVEKALAVDNIFVFLMLMTYFSVPEEQRQRVLVIGILLAIVLRAILIFAGAALLAHFHWMLYVFGAFLLLTGVKMWFAAGKEPDLDTNPVLRWLTAHVPFVRRYHGDALWLGRGRRRKFTPLFIVLVMIGITDVIFAVDSIPAIFAITTDPFIVLTSNVFAVLGLRAMFFLLAGMAERFHLLPYGLAVVLVFIGTKMLLIDVYKIPVLWSLAVVAVILAGTVALSLARPPSPVTVNGAGGRLVASAKVTCASPALLHGPPVHCASRFPAVPMTESVRLARRVIEMTQCSRTDAEQYIKGGWVSVDGQVVEDPAFRVTTEAVVVDPTAQRVAAEPATILLHKPAGYDTITGPKPAAALVRPDSRWSEDASGVRLLQRHFHHLTPLMPLDADASGLMVLTQDGRVWRRLSEDRDDIEQEFVVEVDGEIAPYGLQRLSHGLSYGGRALPPCKVSWQSEIRLRFAIKGVQGGQLRDMCAQVGLDVVAIRRLRIGRVALAKMPEGAWRYLPVGERF